MQERWQAGSEDEAMAAGVIDALKGRSARPPADFPEAYARGFEDAGARPAYRAREHRPAVEAHQLAILGLVHLVIFADRDVDPSEIAWLYEEARYHPVFAGIHFATFRSACLVVLHELHEQPMDELLGLWAEAARSHAAPALELAAGAMLADGVVASPEEGCMNEVISRLGVSRQDASRILQHAFGLARP